jgi:hypothetical protein
MGGGAPNLANRLAITFLSATNASPVSATSSVIARRWGLLLGPPTSHRTETSPRLLTGVMTVKTDDAAHVLLRLRENVGKMWARSGKTTHLRAADPVTEIASAGVVIARDLHA